MGRTGATASNARRLHRVLTPLTTAINTNALTNQPVFTQSYHLRPDGLRDRDNETRFNPDGSVFSAVEFDWTYDGSGRMNEEKETVLFGKANAPAAYDHAFRFDLNGNRVQEQEGTRDSGGTFHTTVANTLYAYNEDDQLLAEQRTSGDPASPTPTTTTTTLYGSYNSANVFAKGYDANGSLTTKSVTGPSTTGTGSSTVTESDHYTWDARNRMVGVNITTDSGSTASTSATTYGYDTSGVRTSETTTTTTPTSTTTTPTTFYVNDPENPTGYTKAIEERAGTTAATATTSRSYVLGLKVEAQSDATNGTLDLLTDGHGSTRALVNTAGVVVQSFDYDAFGTVTKQTDFNLLTGLRLATVAPAKTNWLFGGDGVYDAASGMFDNLARWRTGVHFISRDAAENSVSDPQSLHKYLYTNGNPLSNWDPSGHASLGEILTVIGIGLNVLNFGYHFSSGISHFAHGQTNAGNVDMAWAAIDLFTLGLPFAGPGAGFASAGLDAIPSVLSLSRVGVNIASIWGYLTTLFSVSSGSGGSGSGSSGGGSLSSSSGSWGQPPDNGAPPGATEYQQRIAEQFGDTPPAPRMEFNLGGRWFDGVKQAAKKLIETKGPGYDGLFKNLVDDYGITAPLDKIRKQLLEQSVIAKSYGYTLEVHVAEQSAAQRIQSVAPSGVTVIHTP